MSVINLTDKDYQNILNDLGIENVFDNIYGLKKSNYCDRELGIYYGKDRTVYIYINIGGYSKNSIEVSTSDNNLIVKTVDGYKTNNYSEMPDVEPVKQLLFKPFKFEYKLEDDLDIKNISAKISDDYILCISIPRIKKQSMPVNKIKIC